MQVDQSKMYAITIVFRSWSCSFPLVEVVDQSTVQNSQTVLVALLSLMRLMKVSNANGALHCIRDHSCALFGENETARAQSVFYCTHKSIQICCLS